MAVIFLSLGSNLGDRLANMRGAVSLLAEHGVSVVAKSSIYETEPFGVKSQPLFLNACVKAETSLKPPELLGKLKQIEAQIGRTPGTKWGPRIIDIDILFYDNIIDSYGALTIPHPHIRSRRFVLEPLCEIAPDFTHPFYKTTVKQLLAECDGQEKAQKIGDAL